MAFLNLEIVTPEKRAYSGSARMVVVPGAEGELGILPDHMPLMTQILPGEVQVMTESGEELFLAVGEGFVEVCPDRVSVLTDMAIEEGEIDEKAAEEAVARAERDLRDQALAGEELATVQGSLLKSLAQLKVKRRSHR
jgi:F-type H+-transporting ATPase subunit epsilon